ncbi:uncharacterized protein MONOS_3590 [Monocercomonoides exilis]|uniref:uncharacterized protein n=1 Tax=Monocercomonoides exilis TaxID=2049356 RepID=UPI003559AA6B|nr:hypothetical protein MONOS_3590 [Monocercomonoides exilis]|eukprot:MONOS_3590.1-p1 / transcript=MONOS_3590.1 / gene=MONOS_3590 / organism=Monocercomonoides_exilis_PA203 / gene_product=unspecified product / transcript_product=unspecified product / location=Mono_scaffold00085:135182-136012(-) / protein_length=92 / sequence_SO=supercontig / SO=protein_coding / is_pseudo=false
MSNLVVWNREGEGFGERIGEKLGYGFGDGERNEREEVDAAAKLEAETEEEEEVYGDIPKDSFIEDDEDDVSENDGSEYLSDFCSVKMLFTP